MNASVSTEQKEGIKPVLSLLHFIGDCFIGLTHRSGFFLANNYSLVVGPVFTLVGIAIREFAWGSPAEIMGNVLFVAGAVWTVFSIFRKLWGWSNAYTVPLPVFPPPTLIDAVKRLGYEVCQAGDGVAIYDPETNRALWNSDNSLEVGRSSYQMPQILKEYSGVAFRGLPWDTTNEDKVALKTDVDVAVITQGRPVRLQKTDYFKGLTTNQLGKFCLCDPEHNVLFDGSRFVVENNELVRLDQSIASNHIGINTLALTRDRRIIYQRQGKQVVQSYKLAPSGSGSLDWRDLRDRKHLAERALTFQRLLAVGMERELCEEITCPQRPDSYQTFLTGYARILDRGGKPDFFGITLLNQNSHVLSIRRQEWRRVRQILTHPLRSLRRDDLLVELSRLYEQFKSRQDISMSLVLSLKFAISRIEAESQTFFYDEMLKLS